MLGAHQSGVINTGNILNVNKKAGQKTAEEVRAHSGNDRRVPIFEVVLLILLRSVSASFGPRKVAHGNERM